MDDRQNLKRLKRAARTKHKTTQRAHQFVDGKDIIPTDFIRLEPWEIDYLYMLGKQAKLGVLETGRYRGGSTLVFAHACSVPIYSIDLEPQDDTYLVSLIGSCDVQSDVKLIVGDSQKTKYNDVKQYDLLFIDGDHSFQGCLNDLNNWWDSLAPGGHVVCHDCYFGNEVQDAVVAFLKDKNVNIYLTPYIQKDHWFLPYGSLCHFQKPL